MGEGAWSLARKAKEAGPVIGQDGIPAEGGEKKLFNHPHDASKVVGIYNYERHPQVLKNIFWLSKIGHLLFPEHIPAVHMVASQPQLIVKERISGRALDDMSWDEDDEAAYDEVSEKLVDAGLLTIDGVPENFSILDDGRVVFHDELDNTDSHMFDNWSALKEAIEALDEPDRSKGLTYLGRITRDASGGFGFSKELAESQARDPRDNLASDE